MNKTGTVDAERVYYMFEDMDVPDADIELKSVAPETPAFLRDYAPHTMDLPFWKRQFCETVTSKQTLFDWAFGVALPLICFFFDPFVFRNNGLLAGGKTFFYLLGFGSILMMSSWLLVGSRLKWVGGIFAGSFAVAGVLSLIVGLILFPFSLLGLAVLIGALGFTPLFSSFAFIRNAVRAWRTADGGLTANEHARAFALAAMITAMVPFVAQTDLKSIRSELRDLVTTLRR